MANVTGWFTGGSILARTGAGRMPKTGTAA